MQCLRAALLALIVVASPAFAQSPVLVLVVAGDSLTGCRADWFFRYLNVKSTGDCGVPAAQASSIYFSGNIVAVNMGVAGTRLDRGRNNFASVGAAYIDPIITAFAAASVGDASLIVCGIGSNDGARGGRLRSVAWYADQHAKRCAERKLAGINFAYMATLLPRGDGLLPERYRITYNALLTDPTWRRDHDIDGVIDLAGEPSVGNPENLATYFPDRVHYNGAAAALLAAGPVAGALNDRFPWLLLDTPERAIESLYIEGRKP